MAKVLISTFETEKEAKDFFATVIESSSVFGAFVSKSGKIYLDGTAEPIVAEKKFVVITSSADVFSDKDS